MPDWPAAAATLGVGPGVYSSFGLNSGIGDALTMVGAAFTSASATPAANRAFYIPFYVESTVTAYKMAFIVGAQAGNYDVGIYDCSFNRIVSLGSTAVPAAGLAVADIADTVLVPGTYFMAINLSTVTTLTVNANATAGINVLAAVCGMAVQDVGAVTLPDPATFAAPAAAWVPALSVATRTVI